MRSVARRAALGVAALAVAGGFAAPVGHGRRVITLHGAQPLSSLRIPPVEVGGVTIDARQATFHFGNSRNSAPTAGHDCDQGGDPVNRYPLVIKQQQGAEVVGGLFVGSVPQSTEWSATYCNSAAITLEDAPSAMIDGVRIDGAWDAIRAGRGSPGLRIANSWISNVHDDAVENDFLQPLAISSSLIDGSFQGVSVKPRKDSAAGDASGETMVLSGVVLRLSEYPYKTERRFGALLKSDARAPRLTLVNSVIAVDSAGGRSYPGFWATSWAKLSHSSNNLLLWLSDAPFPDTMPPPPSSIRLVRGPAARAMWGRVRANWINCHPRIARLPSDSKPNPASCLARNWGGF